MASRLLTSLFLLLAIITTSEAKAPQVVVIKNDDGGLVEKYNRNFARFESTGFRVIIDGACKSACTRYMKLQNVCATENGYFYFHAATIDGVVSQKYSQEDSRLTDSTEAYLLEEKYGVFSFGIVKRRPAAKIYLEPGVERVYTSILADANGPFQVWLKVKATKLVNHC